VQGNALIRYFYKQDPNKLNDEEFYQLLAELEWIKSKENPKEE